MTKRDLYICAYIAQGMCYTEAEAAWRNIAAAGEQERGKVFPVDLLNGCVLVAGEEQKMLVDEIALLKRRLEPLTEEEAREIRHMNPGVSVDTWIWRDGIIQHQKNRRA